MVYPFKPGQPKVIGGQAPISVRLNPSWLLTNTRKIEVNKVSTVDQSVWDVETRFMRLVLDDVAATDWVQASKDI